MVKYITSNDAYNLLLNESGAIMIDTRTQEEWDSYGYPDMPGKVCLISSHLKPMMELNPHFIEELDRQAANHQQNLIFMCRSATRSRIAADLAEDHGYSNCYVVSDGFMGSDTGPGWSNQNLPKCFKEELKSSSIGVSNE